MTDPVATSTILPQAFRIMEVSPPSSFYDDSEKARAAVEQYPRARDMVLEGYDWSCARWVVTLAQYTLNAASEEYPDPDLPYAVRLPDGFLKLRHVYDGTTFRWRQDGRLIRSDKSGSLTLRGTRRIERESDLPETVQLAIAYQLAMLLAPRFVTTNSKRRTITEEMSQVLARARDNDAHSAAQHRIDGRNFSDWAAEATL